MSEEYFCVLGRVPKVLSYVRDGKYVRTICRLKDNIDCFMLNEFFNMIYSLKLDVWDRQCLDNEHITVNLIKCFHMILRESKFVNLKDLCFLIKGFANNNSYSIMEVIKEFFEMFEVVEERVVSLNNDQDIKLIAVNSGDMFYKEVESIFYNTKMIDYINNNKVKVKKQSSFFLVSKSGI